MTLRYVTNGAAALAVAGAFVLSTASLDLAAQGRPASPPGQTTRPATPPGRAGGQPQTPPGQAKAPQLPPGQAKVAAPIVVKPALASSLQPLLPGTDLNAAASGFKTLGAFVSAVHVSHNLEIPFSALKTRIVDDGMTLGASIQALKPTANVKLEVERAENQAKAHLAKSDSK